MISGGCEEVGRRDNEIIINRRDEKEKYYDYKRRK